MTTSPLGIDISKLKFDACLVRDRGKLRHHVFPNTAAGFAQLSAWLAKHQVERAHACLEATGAYGEALATHLHAAGHTVSVVNPATIKAYAQSRLSRAKTDKADATLIAQQPKIAPFIPLMKTHIAAALDVKEIQIGIKATTNEKLGFIGREEGIAAMAVASLELPE